MNEPTPWRDPIFLNYVALIGGLLLVGGMILTLVSRVMKKDVSKILVIYKSWLLMAPAVVGCIFLGRVATIVGLAILSMAAFKEFARATGLYRDWWMTGGVHLGIVAVAATSLVSHPHGLEPGRGWYGLFMTMPVYVIAWLLLIPILRDRVEGQLQKLSLSIVGFIYIGWMFGHLGFLANATGGHGYLLFLIVAVEVNDVSAFTFGKLFGRSKFRPNISPNKTWGGALGAWTVSLAMPWALSWSFPHFGPLQLILTGLIVGVGGTLGDLSLSLIKRDVGVKDMGCIIPGHGGILDRVDSLIYTAPLFMHMVDYFYGLR